MRGRTLRRHRGRSCRGARGEPRRHLKPHPPLVGDGKPRTARGHRARRLVVPLRPWGRRSGRGGGGPATDATRKVKESPPRLEGGGATAATGRGARPGEGYAKWGGAAPTVPIRRMRGGSSGADVLGGLRADASEVWGRNPDVFGGGRMRTRCRCWIVETGEINVINYWILGCGTGHKLSHAGERCILARLARSDGLAIKYHIP